MNRRDLLKHTLAAGGMVVIPAVASAEYDRYRYDPRHPVPTYGGHGPVAISSATALVPDGPLEQRSLQQRHDILVYSSDKLTEDIEVMGVV